MMLRLRSLFTVMTLLALAALAVAVPRQCVVLEHFTNTSCGPCFANNPFLEAAVNDMGRDTLVKISYHVNWPGPNDAFYLHNSTENSQRWNWYGVTGVPDMYIGNLSPNFNTAQIKSMARNEFAENCPVAIEEFLAYQLNGEETTVHFSGRLNAESTMPATARLFVALITTNVDPYNSPNGEDHIAEPFRDHGYHATQGLTITAVPGSPQEFTGTLSKLAAWNASDLEAVAFVQNTSGREILQGEVTDVMAEYDMAQSNVDGPTQQIVPVAAGEHGYILELANNGISDDVYTVELDGTWPANWTLTVEEQDGTPSPDQITVSLVSLETRYLFVRANTNGNPGSASFTVRSTSQNADGLVVENSYRMMAGLDVLVIDGDGGETYESYYNEALAAADDQVSMVWGWWDVTLDDVDGSMFDGVDVVLWFTGNRWQETLTPLDQLNLQDYLDAGGNLFLTGQGMGFDMRNDQFFQEYMHATYLRNFPIGTSVTGLPGTLADGEAFAIASGTGANNQTRQSALAPRSDQAQLVFNYDQEFQGESQGAALQVDNGTYKLLYLGFGFEAIATEEARVSMMTNAMEWLLGTSATPESPATLPTEFSLAQNYPNPFNPETSIPFALPARANVKLAVFDLLGREVATLVEGTFEAGEHTVSFNGADLASGVYFYRLNAQAGEQSFNSTRKLVLMK